MHGTSGQLVGSADQMVTQYSSSSIAQQGGWILPAPSAEERRQRAMVARRRKDRACRVLNIIVALAALVISLPLMLVIAAVVKLTSRGPVLYKQSRVGIDRRSGVRAADAQDRRRRDRGGRLFTIYKFRTMTHRRHDGSQVWASADDPRITPLGRFLRKYRLDELPQFWNVLRGDMNIVGPRPEQPQIFEELRTQLRDYPRRQGVLPGITGWAQVNNSYDQSLDDVKRKVSLDLEYIERRSAVEDLKIMAMTVPVMLLKRGAL